MHGGYFVIIINTHLISHPHSNPPKQTFHSAEEEMKAQRV